MKSLHFTLLATIFSFIIQSLYSQCLQPYAGNVTLCGSGEATLTAGTTQGSFDHRWYTAPTGGYPMDGVSQTKLENGTTTSSYKANFTTTTTFYVSSYNVSTGCESSRVAVTVTVNQPPTVSVSANRIPNDVCSLNNDLVLTATSEGSYQWKKNGINISYANASTYHPVESGSYSVLASTVCGSIESSPITVNIKVPQPLSVIISGSNQICQNGNASFSAIVSNSLGSLVSYQWYVGSSPSGPNNSSFSTNSLSDGNSVKCVVTALNGVCASPSSVTSNIINVEVNSVPNAPYPGNDLSNCGSKQATLVASNTGGRYITHHWYNVQTGGNEISDVTTNYQENYFRSSYSIYLSSTTTYYVAASNICGTSARTPVTATINQAPVVSISTNEIPTGICSLNNNLTLTASAASSYQWKLNGNNISGATNNTYHPTAGGNYAVQVTNSCGTVESSPVTVGIVDPANLGVSISGSNEICKGAGASFTASVESGLGSSVNYQWFVGSTASGSNSTVFSTNLTDKRDIKCVVTLKNGVCASPSSVTSNIVSVEVNSVPEAPISGNGVSNCGPDYISLTAINNSGRDITHHWYTVASGGTEISGIPTSVINGNYQSSYKPYLNSTTNYYVSASNTCGTSNRTIVTATINNAPVVTISTNGVIPTNICSTNNNLQLTASAGSSYQWILGGNVVGTGQTYHPTSSGSYHVNVGTSCGTIESSPINVSIVSTQNFSLGISGKNEFCSGNSEIYSAKLQPAEIVSLVKSYEWSLGTTPVGNGSTYSFSPANGGTNALACKVTMVDNACVSTNTETSSLNIKVNSIPDPPSISSFESACGAQNVNLTAANTSGNNIIHHWYNASESEVPNITTSLINSVYQSSYSNYYTAPSTTELYISASNSCGESSRTKATVTINPEPSVSIIPSSSPLNNCEGDGFHLTGNGGISYEWRLNSATGTILGTGNTFIPDQIGDYSIVLLGKNTCNNIKEAQITIGLKAKPSIPDVSTSDQSFCGAHFISDLSVTAPAGSSLQWFDFSSGGNSLNTGSALTTKMYYVRSINSDYCTSDRIPVNVTIN